MGKAKISGGLVHKLPADLVKAITATKEITALWEDISDIARNEFICWVEDAKQEKRATNKTDRGRATRRTKTSMLLGRLYSPNRQKT